MDTGLIASLVVAASYIVIVTVYIVSVKASTKVLDARLEMIDAGMEDFKREMKKLTEILVIQATQSGRIDRVEDRQLAEGKRLDELTQRFEHRATR